MSAVVIATSFEWYCQNCDSAAGPFQDEEDAQLSADVHDKEQHA